MVGTSTSRGPSDADGQLTVCGRGNESKESELESLR